MNATQINPFIHPTQFIMDLEPTAGQEPISLQQFMKTEEDYDLAFSKAWEIFEEFKDQPLVEPTDWLKLLDTIQQRAMSHFSEYEKVGTDPQGKDVFEKRKIGRATKNWYGLSQGGPCSDEEGIKDIIKKIWINEEPFALHVKTDDIDKQYAVILNGFWMMDHNGKTTLLIENTQDTRHKTLEEIFKKVISIYNQGKHPNGGDRLAMLFSEPDKDRETRALQIFQNYLQQIQDSDTKSDVKTIAITIRDLMQAHLHIDGNGRALYILANFMLYQRGQPLFYPRHICMFDGNSVDTMVQEILLGQYRFAAYFGDEKQFSQSFKEYKLSVVELCHKFEHNKEFLPLEKTMKVRDFNLLLRQSGSNETYLPILEFLLQNIFTLDIDVKSKGATSGNVWNVASKYKNQKALNKLQNFVSITQNK